MERFLGYPLRGALGFGLGLFIAAFAADYAPASILINFFGAFLGGAAGATIFMAGGDFHPRAIPGFGVGFALLWLFEVFVHISIQGGGDPQYVWAVLGSAIGFAAGGALGATSIRLGLAISGAATFGVAGALGGFMSFYLIAHGFSEGSMPAAFGFAGVLAGMSFGICVEFLGD
jgi:hypothetical protein